MSFKSYRPRRKEKNPLWAWCLVIVILLGFWFMFWDAVLPKAEAKEISQSKSEAEWEREICGNLEKYANQADFAAYCDWRLTH